MHPITGVANSINDFFNLKAEKISILTGFIKRKRKLTGASFVKTLVLGNMGDGNCSIDTMCQILNEGSIEITKQGLDFRFTEAAVNFMKKMFHESLDLFKKSLPIDCDILKEFGSVKLLDSTQIGLPNTMEKIYKGYGASYVGHKNNNKSAIKIQLIYDYLNQTIVKLDIKEGIRSDQGYRGHLDGISPNDLLIFDLGYFVPEVFSRLALAQAYFICRYKADTNIYDTDTNEKVDLLGLLDAKDFLEKEILLGKEAKIRLRIVCKKLSSDEANFRRRRANKLAKSHGYRSSHKNQQLLDWAIFVTNIPRDKIATEQVLSIYRARWQIELLFKLYKSHIKIEVLKGRTRSFRVLCEFYAKLCVVMLFHGMTSCIDIKKGMEISLTKAILEFKRRARGLLLVLNKSLDDLKDFLKNLFIAWSKFSLKDRRRKKRLSTLMRLRALTDSA